MKITIETSPVEDEMLQMIKAEEGSKLSLEEYADSFFHNNLWLVHDMYRRDQLNKESEK